MIRTTTCIVLACAALGGRARLGLPFPEPVAGPGYFLAPRTIVRIPGEPGQITYDYARTNGSDLAHSIAAADRECSPLSKRAHIASISLMSQDTGRVTFVCL